MKETYIFIRSYFFTGVYSYALFGLYALTISPIITHFLDYGEKDIFISLFGFAMLIAEFFALKFKLKMVRIRAGEKRIAYKKETGIDIIPSTSPIVFFEFFLRLVFRVSIVMVSMTALGYPCTEKLMSPEGVIVLMLWFFADMSGFIYIYFKSDFYTDPPTNKRALKAELKADDDWERANTPQAPSEKYFRMELISDIILQVYALMLFTSFWAHINQVGIEMLYNSLHGGYSAFEAAASLFPMMFIIVMLGLMPIRIAYWIEDSMRAFTKREKTGMWIVFFIVAIFTCSPVIVKFISLFILRSSDVSIQSSESIGHLMSIALFLVLLMVQIFLFRKKDPTQDEKATLENSSPAGGN